MVRSWASSTLPISNITCWFDLKHARAAAKAYAGMTIAQFDAYVKAYAAFQANGFTGMTYGESFYKPMLEVFDYLKANGFTYYVVSGSDRFICRSLVESIGIDKNKVIGMDVWYKSSKQGDNAGVNYNMGSDEDLIRTDSLLIKNLKTNKVLQISQEIGKVPVLSFGNSSGDEAMHNYCKGNQKYRTLGRGSQTRGQVAPKRLYRHLDEERLQDHLRLRRSEDRFHLPRRINIGKTYRDRELRQVTDWRM